VIADERQMVIAVVRSSVHVPTVELQYKSFFVFPSLSISSAQGQCLFVQTLLLFARCIISWRGAFDI
jgi:hypothetical protein